MQTLSRPGGVPQISLVLAALFIVAIAATRGTAHARCRLLRCASTGRSFLRIPVAAGGHLRNVVFASERLV